MAILLGNAEERVERFKVFAVRGNAVAMAVGIITGSAFGSIVNAPVADVITPPADIAAMEQRTKLGCEGVCSDHVARYDELGLNTMPRLITFRRDILHQPDEEVSV